MKNIFGTSFIFNGYLGEIEETAIRRWKQLALALPYLIVCAFIIADVAHSSKFELFGFSVIVIAFGALGVPATRAFNAAMNGPDFDINLIIYTVALPILLPSILLGTLLYWYENHRPPRIRRIGLLYAQYFGVNGSLFSLKVITLQTLTVILQSTKKLLHERRAK